MKPNGNGASPKGWTVAWIAVPLVGTALLIYGLIGGFNEIRYHNSGKIATAHITNSTTIPIFTGTRYKHRWISQTDSNYVFTVDAKGYGCLVDDCTDRSVKVEYLPSNPAVHRLADESWFPVGTVSLLAGMSLLAVGVFGLSESGPSI